VYRHEDLAEPGTRANGDRLIWSDDFDGCISGSITSPWLSSSFATIYEPMSVLSDFIIASGDSVPSYDGISGYPDADRCQFKRITPLEAAGLLEALRGEGDRISMLSEFPLLTPEEAEMWTMGVPEDFVIRLAELDSAGIARVAEQFSRITAEELGWSTEDSISTLTDLTSLARRARAEQKRMYLWNSL
jgi:hypothetical protein